MGLRVAYIRFQEENSAGMIVLSDGRVSKPFMLKRTGKELIEKAREKMFVDKFERLHLLESLHGLQEEIDPDEVIFEEAIVRIVTLSNDGEMEKTEIEFEDGFTTVPLEELEEEVLGESEEGSYGPN